MVKLPLGVDIHNLIDDLRVWSWEAADILLFYSKILRDNGKKIIKSNKDEDPVTIADLKVNDLIIQRIQSQYRSTEWEILSEENSKIDSFNINVNADWLWVLDPLDGTKDFIQGTGNYAMHLALNYKQKPLLGVVLIPEKDELWISDGENAWCESRNGSKKTFKLSKLRELKDLTIVTSKNHNNSTLKNLLEKINFKKVMVMGSIGCKVASILRGESDIYICLSLPGKSSPKDWDFAAPAVILNSAGGSVTNLFNKELIYNKSNFEQGGVIIASKDLAYHERLCLEINEIIVKNGIYSGEINSEELLG